MGPRLGADAQRIEYGVPISLAVAVSAAGRGHPRAWANADARTGAQRSERRDTGKSK